jgi:hypothetical protein
MRGSAGSGPLPNPITGSEWTSYIPAIRSESRLIAAARYLGRGLGLLPLEEGLYVVIIMPLNNVSPLKPFRIELELNSPPV